MFASQACFLLLLQVIHLSHCFECDENALHCMTSLIIDNSFTMIDKEEGPLYTQDKKVLSVKSGKEVDVNSVVTADGWNMTRKLITANGTMPGPDIIVHQNQTITIVVYNHLLSEEVSIHWHGIEQFGTPAMDGVPFVTQCPILPGQSFNYTFTPRIGGTYFYHSHIGVQFDMGLFGAFIVLRKRDPIPYEHQRILQFQDWNHLVDPETMLKSTTNMNIEYHSVLINGRGEHGGNTAPLHKVYVDKSERYLFRLISVAANEHFLFSIPGVRLIVRETDGDEVSPITVDRILLFTGERYDVELDLQNVTVGVYDIFAHFINGRNLGLQENNPGHAFLHVTNNKSLSSSDFNISREIQVILNCPVMEYPNRPNWTCVHLSALKSLDTKEDINVIEKSSKKSLFFLNNNFIGFSFAAINGKIFKMPSVAALLQPSEIDTSCPGCDAETTCMCSHSLSLESGSEVIFVFHNSETMDTLRLVHPIHIHGHKFQVLKIGLTSVEGASVFPTSDIQCSDTLSNSVSRCHDAKWANTSWNDYKNIPDIDWENGVYKDTVAVPPGGYVVARIWATNPGVWLLHCHRSRHLFKGMNLMLNESFEHSRNLPDDLPTCRSFEHKEKPIRDSSSSSESPASSTTTAPSTTMKVSTASTKTPEPVKESSMFGDGGDTTALAIIIVLSIFICILAILQVYTIRQLRNAKSVDLF